MRTSKKLSKKWTIEEEEGIELLSSFPLNSKKNVFVTKGKTIELCCQDQVNKYESQINIILKLLGHKEALVTDESSISDFLCLFSCSKKDKMYNKRKLKKLSDCVGFEVLESNLIIDVAKKIKNGSNFDEK